MMYILDYDSAVINRIFSDEWLIESITKFYYDSFSKSDVDVRFVAEYLSNILKKIKDAPPGTKYIIFNDDERHTLNKYIGLNLLSIYDSYCRNDK